MIKCVKRNMEVFVDFVVRLGNEREAEWKTGVLGQLGGATPAADGRTFFIRDGGLPPHCSALYLHLTFNSSREAGRTSLSLKESRPNTLILTHPLKHKHHQIPG